MGKGDSHPLMSSHQGPALCKPMAHRLSVDPHPPNKVDVILSFTRGGAGGGPATGLPLPWICLMLMSGVAARYLFAVPGWHAAPGKGRRLTPRLQLSDRLGPWAAGCRLPIAPSVQPAAPGGALHV